MPFTKLIDETNLHYEVSGTGFPVITIHGWLGTPSRDLANVNEWLSETYTVYSPTLRGYGESRPPQRNFSVDFYERDADDILSFMDTIGIEKAHLLGYSDGGETAIIVAGKAPERFETVISWGAVGYFGEDMRRVANNLLTDTFLEEDDALKSLHGIENAQAFIEDWVQAVIAMIDNGGDVSLKFAKDITMPFLLLLGDGDTLNPPHYGKRLVDLTAQGKLKVIENSGHKIHQVQWDVFKDIVGDFLLRYESL